MNKYFLIFFVLITIIDCSKGAVHMSSVNNKWNKNNELKYTLSINDEQFPKNIIFVVRNNNEYKYSNLFLIVNLKGEKGKIFKTDTLNYILAKPSGEWLGTGFGGTKEIMFQYRNNYKFPEKGKYVISIKHGMRTDNLIGIEDIGVKIENSIQP